MPGKLYIGVRVRLRGRLQGKDKREEFEGEVLGRMGGCASTSRVSVI
jgi:hypothetical protein